MRIAILGAPGCGKKAQARSLAARHRLPCIVIDDLARAADQAAGRRAPRTDDGDLALLEERLRARDSRRGFIIDGFPRNIPQAQSLDALLGMLGGSLQIAIHISATDDTLLQRIKARLRCTECGAEFNRYCAPPASRGKCDLCGGKLVADAPRAKQAAADIAAYHEQSETLAAYYKAQHKLRTVIAADSDAEVERKIGEIVDLEVRPLEVKTVETAADAFDEEVSTVIAGGQINRIAHPPEPEPTPALAPAPVSVVAPQPVEVAASPAKRAPRKSASTTASKAAKKAASKKAAAKKTTAKKSVAKKPVAKKSAAKKPVAKKTARKKPATKKKPIKRSPAKPRTAKKTPSNKKTASKKTAARKPARAANKKAARKR